MTTSSAVRELEEAEVVRQLVLLEAAQCPGNQLPAKIGVDYGGVCKEQMVDQIVANHGTIPLDELYDRERRDQSSGHPKA